MLDELMTLTATEPYRTYGGMRIKEVLIQPWENPDAIITLEIWVDDMSDDPHELWEIICTNLGQTDGIPLAVFGGSEIGLFDDHPLLWDSEIYFSITSTATDITVLVTLSVTDKID